MRSIIMLGRIGIVWPLPAVGGGNYRMGMYDEYQIHIDSLYLPVLDGGMQ